MPEFAPEPQRFEIAGVAVSCTICAHDTFWQRTAQLNTTFDNVRPQLGEPIRDLPGMGQLWQRPVVSCPNDDSDPTMTRSSSEDSRTQPPATRRSWRWLPRALLESVLIVFSVLFALGMDEWRLERARAEQAAVALEGIRAELAQNLESVEIARANHLAMRDSLRHYVALRQEPPPEIYLHGIFNPAPTQAVAWESARDIGSTAELRHSGPRARACV
jgi:hypothetical protein